MRSKRKVRGRGPRRLKPLRVRRLSPLVGDRLAEAQRSIDRRMRLVPALLVATGKTAAVAAKFCLTHEAVRRLMPK